MKFNKWESDLKNVVKFWIIWNDYKKTRQGKYSDLSNFLSKEISFEDALVRVLEYCYGIFSPEIIDRIENKTNEVFNEIKKAGVFAITYDHFKDVPALSNIKGASFLFIKGDLEILNNDHNNFVSVVGSRKTPLIYKKWIDKVVPHKIIVSGLANGADVLAHEWAIEKKLKIVVYPGVDIYKKPVKKSAKKRIWDYAEKNGVLISDLFPGSNNFDENIFLKRNKWMAQMVDETYAAYFEGQSGTLGQLLEVSRRGGKVYLPKDVFNNNKEFLSDHKPFNEILKSVVIK